MAFTDAPVVTLCQVTVSGGSTNGNPFLGHLSADVVVADPEHQIVAVNPVTTLVSLLLDERPDLKLDDAQALVRNFLVFPANCDLGMALRESSGYESPFFSPVEFSTVMQSAGLPTQGASSGDIAALQQGLADLQSAVAALSSQVAELSRHLAELDANAHRADEG